MKDYYIHLQGEFNDSLMYAAVDQMEGLKQEAEKLHREFPGDTFEDKDKRHGKVTILFSSSGGLMSVGFGLYDYLRDFEQTMACFGWEVEGKAVGIVGSACVYAYLGLDTRSAFPNTQFLLHPSSIPTPGDAFLDHATLNNLMYRLQQGSVIGTHILKERTKMSLEQIFQLIGKEKSGETILFVSEAADYGFITKLL